MRVLPSLVVLRCDRHEFAKRVFVADFQIGGFAAIFQILRLLADRAVGVEFVLLAGFHRSAERNVMLEPAVCAKHDIRSDHAIRVRR